MGKQIRLPFSKFEKNIYLFNTKSEIEVFEKFEDFLSFAERQSGQKLNAIPTDNGMEFMNKRIL